MAKKKFSLPEINLAEIKKNAPIIWSVDPERSGIDDRGALIVIRYWPHKASEKDGQHKSFRFSRAEFNFVGNNFDKVHYASHLARNDKPELKESINKALKARKKQGLSEKEILDFFETDGEIQKKLEAFARAEAEVRLMASMPW